MVEAVTELTCARCERPSRRTRVPWPEGVICEACRKQASRRRGTCATCAVERLLPGNDGHGNPICVDCAGIRTSFRCASCGVEDEFWYAQTCLRCSLHRRLGELLDDGTGRVAPLLLPLLSVLCAADPSRGLSWLRSAPVRDNLRALASGRVAITHAGLDVLGRSSGVEYLRDLLMAHGVLPRRDKHLAQSERWAALRLETVAHAEDRSAITAYVRWQLRRLRADASTGELGKSKALTLLANKPTSPSSSSPGFVDEGWSWPPAAKRTSTPGWLRRSRPDSTRAAFWSGPWTMVAAPGWCCPGIVETCPAP